MLQYAYIVKQKSRITFKGKWFFKTTKKKQLSWKSENAQESNEREKSRNPQTDFFFG